MSVYALICVACSHRWETECSHLDVFDAKCPNCNRDGAHIDRDEIDAGLMGGRQYVGRAWRGKESVCLEMPLIPKENLAAWKRDIPDIQTNDRGQVVFNSDAHQRKVWKQYRALESHMKEAGKP